ncbi:MAG TPA: aminoglycoside phosphotransferase family protein [Jatrophihabitans sp.]|nr:aminoglycoside phosphotransferase family protein [Jatrophihabitans sp.]
MLHADELTIDVPLARALVDRALPEYAALPLTRLPSSGSSNALFRLGDELLVRLPRQPGGSATIDKEVRWTPYVAPALPVAVPEIVAVGRPDLGYPERWSVVRWIDGEVPSFADPLPERAPDRRALAADLAGVVAALRDLPVPERALTDPGLRWYRGEPLAARDAGFRSDVEACRSIPDLDLDLDAAVRVWGDVRALPDDDRPGRARWYHGDLLGENLLTRGSRLAAVLDLGGLAVGDPTVDLVVAWELLDPAAREVFRRAVGVDDATWLRGRAWALVLAVMTFPYYWHTMPERCAGRLAMARAVLADAAA